MAAPGAVVVAKILVPQTEDIDRTIEVTKEKIGSNVLDAISNGTSEGLKLAVNVAAMLLVFLAFIAMANFILLKVGGLAGLNPVIAEFSNGQYTSLSLQFILGYLFAPLMWLLGVATPDITLVGRLLGEKIIMTEFIGYVSLAELKEAGAFVSGKSIIMATYILCGFANFASYRYTDWWYRVAGSEPTCFAIKIWNAGIGRRNAGIVVFGHHRGSNSWVISASGSNKIKMIFQRFSLKNSKLAHQD
jgi:nucleoside permease NupC